MTKLTKKVARTVAARVPHGVKPNIVVSLHPDGIIGLREANRRDEYQLDVGALYVQTLLMTSRKIVRRTKEIRKKEGISTKEARARARAEVFKKL